MPRDQSLKHILIIGSGPIIIGQPANLIIPEVSQPQFERRRHYGITHQFQSGDHHDRSGHGRSCLSVAA